jgi:hypothetical protein
MTRAETASRLRRLAAHLQTVEQCGTVDGTFNQRYWVHPCGSPACIAGYATEVVGELDIATDFRVVRDSPWEDIQNRRTWSTGTEAFRDAFGITTDEANGLVSSTAEHQTPAAAARAVERVATRYEGRRPHRRRR